MADLYLKPDKGAILERIYGKSIADLDTPAAVVDLAKVRKNCDGMLKVASDLGVHFRAHTKTHKTVEMTALQVGADAQTKDIRLVVSTVAEISHLLPWLSTLQKKQGEDQTKVDIIYGLPISKSNIPRIMKLLPVLQNPTATQHAISFLVDHVDQLKLLAEHHAAWPVPGPIQIFIKIDTGYHRSGVQPRSSGLTDLLATLKGSASKSFELRGLYSHLGHSYAGNSPEEAIIGLIHEITSLKQVSQDVQSAQANTSSPFVLTVGATPTTTAAAQIFSDPDATQSKELKSLLSSLKSEGLDVELHAGVYPCLDMQQCATKARPKQSAMPQDYAGLGTENIAFTVLAEVVSLYTDREKPEALISAGSLALGREPCKSYSGWGVVTPWSAAAADEETPKSEGKYAVFDPEDEMPTGWIVGRISQEHGILTWEGPRDRMRELKIGDKVRVWPNHACIAGVGFGWYHVVDSRSEEPEMVRDVWVRCRGW